MQETPGSARHNTISLLDLLTVLIRHRWLIILSTFIGALLIVAYSVYTVKVPPDAPFNILPNLYHPTVQVRLQDTQKQSLSSFLSNSNLGILANFAGGSAGGSSNAELAQDLLTGNTLLDELAAEFDLVERLSITKYPKASTRSFLKSSFDTVFSASTGILTIGFINTDRDFATAVLNKALLKLEQRFKALTLTSVHERKAILEQSITDYEKELKTSQQTLIDFQKRYGIISITLQTEYKLQAIAEVDSQILAKTSEYRTLQETRRSDDPELRRTRMELETLKERRNILQSGESSDGTPMSIPQAQLPELSARFLNLTRDLQIVQTIYSGLRSQYESLKIEEKSTSNQFQIIEEAEVPELKYRPSRSKICAVVTISVFFLSMFLAFVLEYFDRIRHDPVESEKLRDIKKMVGRSR